MGLVAAPHPTDTSYGMGTGAKEGMGTPGWGLGQKDGDHRWGHGAERLGQGRGGSELEIQQGRGPGDKKGGPGGVRVPSPTPSPPRSRPLPTPQPSPGGRGQGRGWRGVPPVHPQTRTGRHAGRQPDPGRTLTFFMAAAMSS